MMDDTLVTISSCYTRKSTNQVLKKNYKSLSTADEKRGATAYLTIVKGNRYVIAGKLY